MWNRVISIAKASKGYLTARRLRNDLKREGYTVTGQKASRIIKELNMVMTEPIKASAIYEKEPYGEYIYNGKKTLLIRDRPFNILGRQYVLLSGKKAYGVIKFSDMKEISLKEFAETEYLHKITDKERSKLFGDSVDKLYSYSFKFIPYPEPIEVEIPDNIHNFCKEVKVRADFIKDIKTFNPETVETKELIRDWSLVIAWYSNFMSKKSGTYPSGITSNEQLEDLAFLIYKELRKRGIEFHPEMYSKYGKELFDKVVLRAETGLIKHNLAVINHGHYNDYDKPIFLQDILHCITNFKTKSPWVYLVGGIVNHGYTYGDVDILIRGERDKALEFRLSRMFPPEISKRIHFLYDTQNYGPFTNYIPIIDQMASVNELSVKEMGFKRIPPPFAYYGGKRRQSTYLREYIPKHKIYVEPFAGSAALYFAKRPSEIEVLNDWNRDIYETFLFLRDSTPDERRILRIKFPYKIKVSQVKTFMKKTQNYPPRTRLGKVARFIILTSLEFLNKPAPDIHEKKKVGFITKDSKSLIFLKHLEDYKERLSNTRIYNTDWKNVVKKYDSEDTFFFIDPPYAQDNKDRAYVGGKYGTMKYDEIINVVKNIKGKWMLTHDAPSLRNKLVSLGFRSYRIKFTHSGSVGASYKRKNKFNEYVITNFPMQKSEKYSLDEDSEDSLTFSRVIKDVEEEAERSMKEDAIVPLRFFYQLKGLMGYRENEVYNIKSLVDILNDKNKYPYEVDKKYDGFRVQIHKTPTDIRILSEGGTNYTRRFPNIVKQVNLISNDTFVIEGEIEGWEDGYENGKHYGRSNTAGYANSKQPIDDSKYYLTIYDVLYWNEDIHKKQRSDRLKYIEDIKRKIAENKDIKQVKTVYYKIANNEKELEDAVNIVRKLPSSEGAMIKELSSIYSLTGTTNEWIKFKNEADIDVIVIGRDKVKGQEAWNYYCAIYDENDNIVPVGMTYNTKIKVPIGKILRVALINLNKYTDTKTNKIWYNWWSPRPIEFREDKSQPDNTMRANILVKDTNGEIADKPLKPQLSEAVIAYERNKPIDMELYDPFLMLPYKPTTEFVLQAHIRGKSVHLDLRRRIDEDYLVGMTLMIPFSLKKEPQSFEEAKRMYYEEIHPELLKIFSEHERKLLCEPKSIQPVDWLNVEGERKPGEIGATKDHYGYFIIVDKGKLDWLAQKPDFHEYWYYGSVLRGKYVDRLIEGDKPENIIKDTEMALIWQFFYTKNTPYVICPRSINKHYITPYNRSQLPSRIEAKIPAEYRYWEIKNDNERFNVRKKLVEQITAKRLKLSYQGKLVEFKLQYQSWKGQYVIRVGPSKEVYRLIFKLKDDVYYGIEMDKDPREGSVAGQFLSFSKEFWDAEGDIHPKSIVNQTKETHSKIEILERGNVKILIWTPEFKRFVFKSKTVKGTYQAIKKSDNLWILSRFDLLQMSLSLDKVRLDPKTDFLHISGPCLLETVAKGHVFPEESLKNISLSPEYADKKLAYINWQHKRDEWNKVGILTRVWWNNKDKRVWFEGVITEKTAIAVIVERYNNSEKLNVSAEVRWECDETTGRMKDIVVTGLALTDNPAIKEAGITKVCDDRCCIEIPKSKIVAEN